MPTERRASCRCGQLTITCTGDPVRVSVCHCHDCQKRSGSAFAAQARFASQHVAITGEARSWESIGDSGTVTVFRFCPVCGSPMYYQQSDADLVAIAVGAFADSAFPQPDCSVYEERKHPWLAITGDGIDHID